MAHRQVTQFSAASVATTVSLVGCSRPLSSAPGQPSPSSLVLHVNPGATVDEQQFVAPNGGWVITGGRLLTTSDHRGNTLGARGASVFAIPCTRWRCTRLGEWATSWW